MLPYSLTWTKTMDKTTKLWLNRVKKKPVAFGHAAGFDKLTDLHNNWLKLFLYSKEDITLQAHRGSYKTTCLAIAIALLIVLQPKSKIIFLRKSDDGATEIVKQVAKVLQTDIFGQLTYALYGVELQLTTDTSSEINTNLNTTSGGAGQLRGYGIKGAITGKHADIIITDDIVDRSDRTSPAERQKTIDVVQELTNIINAGGRFINTGTPWHKDDAFTLMPEPVQYSCYDTGLMTGEDIKEKRASMDASLFAANYELRHIASGEVLFPEPVIDNGANTYRIYDGQCHIDAAYSGADYNAFTIAKEAADGKIYVFGRLDAGHIDDVLPQFERDRVRYRAGTLHNETNADKGYLAKRIKQPVKKYHESMNKHVKITTYLKQRWRDVVFIKDTDPAYIEQITEYSENSAHDDAPDSLASLLREQQQGHVHVKVMKNFF